MGGGVLRLEPFKVVKQPVTDRWKNFLEYLEQHGNDYEQVFITDTRDVIFQGDVFESLKKHSSYLGYVTEGANIDTNGWNYKKLFQSFNDEKVDGLIGKPVICCGTVIGTTNEMKIFLHTMLKYLPGAKVGYDQATQQYITYNNLLPIENLIKIDAQSGEIFTSFLFHLNHPVETRDEFILRGDGGIPAIVHQYDRQGSLIRLIDRVYRDRNFQADEKFSDTLSNLEQVKQLLHIGKIDEATRFAMAKIHDVTNPDENIVLLLRIWQLLLLSPFTPGGSSLELLIQNALSSVKSFSVGQLNTLCSHTVYAFNHDRVLTRKFLKSIAQSLLNTSEQSFKEANKMVCHFCTNTVNLLPPDKTFYLLQAEAYRGLGRKDEALAAYQKSLDLS